MKLVHFTIHTDKFEQELLFYQNIIGLKIVRDARPARNMVFLADKEGDTAIEIIDTPDAADAGNEHTSIGFHTRDANAKREELVAMGHKATEIISPNPLVHVFFVKDPAGVRVQFILE